MALANIVADTVVFIVVDCVVVVVRTANGGMFRGKRRRIGVRWNAIDTGTGTAP